MTKKEKLYYYRKYFGKFYEQYPGLLSLIEKSIHEDFYRTDAVRQVAYATHMLPEEYNFYKGFLEIIKKYHSLDQNICEIGAGFYPVLSRMILKEQELLQKGSITAIDPDLIVPNHSKIKIKKDIIESNTNMEEYDLLLAYMPCEATIPMIDVAKCHHLPYVLALCGCIHDASYIPYYPDAPQVKRYQASIIDYAKKNLEENMELKIETLSEQYEVDYPILTKTRK